MSNKLVIILGVVLVLVMATFGAGFYVVWTKLSNLNTARPGQEKTEAEAAAAAPVALFPLDTFIVNLADEGGRRYLRLTMQLEVKGPKTVEELKMRLPVIRDAILRILPTRKYDDIRSVEGKNALRKEIQQDLNASLGSGEITNIYFTEFVIQ